MPMKIPAGPELPAATLTALGSVKLVTGTPSAATTTSGTFATIAGVSTQQIFKLYATSRLEIEMHVTSQCSVAGPCDLVFGASLTTLGSVPVAWVRHDAITNPANTVGITVVSGAPQGLLTITPIWRRSSGVGTGQLTTSCRVAILVQEIFE